MLIPSTITARRTRRYTSTLNIHGTIHRLHFKPMEAADGPICNRHLVDVQRKASSLTGQQKCHIHSMENVTLTPKEQTRLRVLNSLLAEHMTLDQAAE